MTRGLQADDESQTLDLFQQHFVDEQLVNASAGDLIVRAKTALRDGLRRAEFVVDPTAVSQFVETINQLYAGMDASLRFKPTGPQSPPSCDVPSDAGQKFDREADFRGVVCPLNYVKTKLLLEQMRAGETLSVLLDEPGTRNVPDSVRNDGHSVLAIDRVGTHWKVVIRKA